MADADLNNRVEAVRHFNRFYTEEIGVLRKGFLESPFSLAELRVMYELLHRDNPTATEIGHALGLDAGYLSRMLRNFERRGFIKRARSKDDGRQSHVSLTRKGHEVYAPLDRRQHEKIVKLLKSLSSADQRRLVEAMRAIEKILGSAREEQ